ncbi:MAG: hypothetical protein RIK87_15235 [Fuerstiella sp.]
MWHTSEGDRVLTGAEAGLFKAALTELVEQVKCEANDGDPGYSIALFHDLTWSQRLAVLEHVTSHLLLPTMPSPKLTAVSEAAIGTVFEYISLQIDREMDDQPAGASWRQQVLDACQECFPESLTENETAISSPHDEDEADFPRSCHCDRRDLWHHLVELLADRILWDRDYEMLSEFMDEPPEKAAMMKQIMGIDDDYFASAADDLNSPLAVQQTLNRLAGLLN